MILKTKSVGQFTCELTEDMENFYGYKDVCFVRKTNKTFEVFSGNTYVGRISLVKNKIGGFDNLPSGIESKYKGIEIEGETENKVHLSYPDKALININLDRIKREPNSGFGMLHYIGMPRFRETMSEHILGILNNSNKPIMYLVKDRDSSDINIPELSMTAEHHPLILHSPIKNIGLIFYKSDLLIDLTEEFGGNFEIIKGIKDEYYVYNSDICYPTLYEEEKMIVFAHTTTKIIGKCEFNLKVKDNIITNIECGLPAETKYPKILTFLLNYVGSEVIIKEEEKKDKIVLEYTSDTDNKITYYNSNIVSKLNATFNGDFKISATNIKDVYYVYDSKYANHIIVNNNATFVQASNSRRYPIIMRLENNIITSIENTSIDSLRFWECKEIYNFLSDRIGLPVEIIDNYSYFEITEIPTNHEKVHCYKCDLLDKINATFKTNFMIASFPEPDSLMIYDASKVKPIILNNDNYFFTSINYYGGKMNPDFNNYLHVYINNDKIGLILSPSRRNLNDLTYHTIIKVLGDNITHKTLKIKKSTEVTDIIDIVTFADDVTFTVSEIRSDITIYHCDMLDSINKDFSRKYILLSFIDAPNYFYIYDSEKLGIDGNNNHYVSNNEPMILLSCVKTVDNDTTYYKISTIDKVIEEVSGVYNTIHEAFSNIQSNKIRVESPNDIWEKNKNLAAEHHHDVLVKSGLAEEAEKFLRDRKTNNMISRVFGIPITDVTRWTKGKKVLSMIHNGGFVYKIKGYNNSETFINYNSFDMSIGQSTLTCFNTSISDEKIFTIILSNDGTTVINTLCYNDECNSYTTALNGYKVQSTTKTENDAQTEAVVEKSTTRKIELYLVDATKKMYGVKTDFEFWGGLYFEDHTTPGVPIFKVYYIKQDTKYLMGEVILGTCSGKNVIVQTKAAITERYGDIMSKLLSSEVNIMKKEDTLLCYNKEKSLYELNINGGTKYVYRIDPCKFVILDNPNITSRDGQHAIGVIVTDYEYTTIIKDVRIYSRKMCEKCIIVFKDLIGSKIIYQDKVKEPETHDYTWLLENIYDIKNRNIRFARKAWNSIEEGKYITCFNYCKDIFTAPANIISCNYISPLTTIYYYEPSEEDTNANDWFILE